MLIEKIEHGKTCCKKPSHQKKGDEKQTVYCKNCLKTISYIENDDVEKKSNIKIESHVVIRNPGCECNEKIAKIKTSTKLQNNVKFCETCFQVISYEINTTIEIETTNEKQVVTKSKNKKPVVKTNQNKLELE